MAAVILPFGKPDPSHSFVGTDLPTSPSIANEPLSPSSFFFPGRHRISRLVLRHICNWCFQHGELVMKCKKWLASGTLLLFFLLTKPLADDAIKDPKPAAPQQPLALA